MTNPFLTKLILSLLPLFSLHIISLLNTTAALRNILKLWQTLTSASSTLLLKLIGTPTVPES